MDALKKGWYSDVNPEWPGQAFSLEVEEVLHQEKTQETDILIFKRYVGDELVLSTTRTMRPY